MNKLLNSALMLVFSYSSGAYKTMVLRSPDHPTLHVTFNRFMSSPKLTPKDLIVHYEFSSLAAKNLCLIDNIISGYSHSQITNRTITPCISDHSWEWETLKELYLEATKMVVSNPTTMNGHRFFFIVRRVAKLAPFIRISA